MKRLAKLSSNTLFSKYLNAFVFLFYLLIALILYYPTRNAGFVHDAVSWLLHYRNGTYLDALNSFGYKGLHPILHTIALTFYKLFGLNGLLWYLAMTFIHALNAWIFFLFTKTFLKEFKIEESLYISFSAALLFIIHPYNVEPVVWRACVHYLLSFAFIVFGLYCVIRSLQGAKTHYWIAVLLYVLSLFSLELAYAVPFFWFAIALYFYLAQKNISLYRLIGQYLLIPFGLLGGYMALTYLKIGAAVGHYGADAHLQFDFIYILKNTLNYFTKHLFFGRHLKLFDTDFYSTISQPFYLIFLLLILIGLIIFFILKKKLKQPSAISTFFLLLFIIALLPVINLFFAKLLLSENDRYGYLASPFIIVSFVLFCLQFKNKIKWLPVFIYGVASIYFFIPTIYAWKQTGEISKALVQDFDYFNKKEIIFLNTPDGFQGVYMFRVSDSENSMFEESVDLIRGQKNTGTIMEVAQFMMISGNEKFAISSDTSMHLKVSFAQWGSWWIKNSLGASAYETERYKFQPRNIATYDLYFKGNLNPEKTAVLYYQDQQWHEIDLDVIRSEQEQRITNYDPIN